MNEYTQLIITALIVGAVFGFFWHKGYLLRIANYVSETRDELKKCTWPSTEELKGSTVVVMLTIALLGGFTVGVDSVLRLIISYMAS